MGNSAPQGFKVIVAIDFGTDGVGLAFSLPNKDEIHRDQQIWARNTGNVQVSRQMTKKTKTSILINRKGTKSFAFGTEALFRYPLTTSIHPLPPKFTRTGIMEDLNHFSNVEMMKRRRKKDLFSSRDSKCPFTVNRTLYPLIPPPPPPPPTKKKTHPPTPPPPPPG